MHASVSLASRFFATDIDAAQRCEGPPRLLRCGEGWIVCQMLAAFVDESMRLGCVRGVSDAAHLRPRDEAHDEVTLPAADIAAGTVQHTRFGGERRATLGDGDARPVPNALVHEDEGQGFSTSIASTGGLYSEDRKCFGGGRRRNDGHNAGKFGHRRALRMRLPWINNETTMPLLLQ